MSLLKRLFPPVSSTDVAPQDLRLLQSERTICLVRWLIAVFAVVQIETYYLPYPSGAMAMALATVGVLVVGNVAFTIILRRPLQGESLRRVVISGLALEWAVATAFVFVYAFDINTAIWAVIYLLPLAGAIRFQLAGAMWVTIAATVSYTAREIYGYFQYGNEIYVASITFRMGIALIIAYVAGTTASRLLEESNEVADANRELSGLNASMRDFVAIASHDMRTPLAVVSGFSAFMLQHWNSLSDEQRMEYVQAIDRQNRQLVRLVNDLLTISSIDAGTTYRTISDVNVVTVAKNAWESVSGAGMTTIEADPYLAVRADESHVERMLVNLLTNAVKHGGRPIRITANALGDTVEIRVIDAGTGVDPNFAPHLFERFSRPRETGDDGTGLGLSIVKGLAEVNDGAAGYRTNKPTGAVFYVQLPRAETTIGQS